MKGFTYPIQTYFLEEVLEITGHRLTSKNQVDDYGQEKSWKMQKQAYRKKKSRIAYVVEDALKAADFSAYGSKTRESLSCWEPDSIGFNLIESVLVYICQAKRPGAVLVFMTGWDDINSFKDQLQGHAFLGDPTKALVLTCHGSMPSSEQKQIFDEPASGVRKIVLATNIAETSITINDVVFIIDCGKLKETSYDALNDTPCLLPSWISKASAQQRRGRAGRVQPGECYHLYPKCVYNIFEEYQLPELLRTPLQSLCLQIKSLRFGCISQFLSKALQPPDPLSVRNAIEYLKIIGALDENEDLTILGCLLSKLPVEPKLGKMLVFGAIFSCLDPILTIVACLSVKDPFLMPFDKKDMAESAKSQFSCEDYSDHLVLVRAYEGWKEAERNQSEYEYCWKNFLSVQTLKAIDSIRKQLFNLLKDAGLVGSSYYPGASNMQNNESLVRAVICAGLYPGICSVLNKEKSVLLKTKEDGPVVLCSNSVNAREAQIPYPWLVFNEKVKVNSVFIRDSTAISDSVLLLFGGDISRGQTGGQLNMLGGYLEFLMASDVAEMYLNLKRKLQEFVQQKLMSPKMDIQAGGKLVSAVQLLLNEDPRSGSFICSNQQPVSILSRVSLPQGNSAGGGGENSKNHLQSLLVKAGHGYPIYTTKPVKNQFRATVEFSGLQFVGRLYSSKKFAEKDAAVQALEWLIGGVPSDIRDIDWLPVSLKKSKREPLESA